MKWGNWTLDPKRNLLVHPHYEVSLGEMKTNAVMMDWIFQILPKHWTTAEDIHELLTALDDIFIPQENLCGGGQDKQIDNPRALIHRYVMSQS
ncbi:hypothetical protein GmRootV118_17700 [Variovorax sp. V118]|uniref:hypothetical protein n=1 Tax=Variovorax sp. V118 TaxID=3065954 RepID=UPI0034E85C57